MTSFLRAGDHIMLTGDSITDWGRDRNDPTSLGHGYAMIVAALLGAHRPELNLTFTNTAVGGDTSAMLEARWADDVLAPDPTIISIMIGINDTWRRYSQHTPTTTQKYEDSYRRMLDAAVQHGIDRFILIDPFLAPVTPDQKLWWDDLSPRIDVVHRLATEHGALLVRAADVFRSAAAASTAARWCADGVHPTTAGHGLLAQTWLARVEGPPIAAPAEHGKSPTRSEDAG